MIYGNMKYLDQGTQLENVLMECFQYAKEHNLLEFETGRHDIDGDRLFVNIVSYPTTTVEERFWEAHKKYLDLHLMLVGEEQIDLNFIHELKQNEFVEADDFLPLEGKKKSSIVLGFGDFLVCYPEDAHMTALKVQESVVIKKAIFKIKIED